MKKQERKVYLVPQLVVVEFKTEKGYADSKGLGLIVGKGSKDLEGREDGGDWGDGSWF